MSEYDLVVVGGGPAGSTVSTMVAMQGHKVLLLEREKFPRHQIGESLLPATIHGICPLLGVSEEVKNANFMFKRGGTFRWGKNQEPWSFNFSASPKMTGPTGFAYQVEREKFDHILLNNAKKKGVEVREQCVVTDVIMDGERVAGVRYMDEKGAAREVTAKYVADTSGHQSRISEKAGSRVYSKYFQNVALYGYFEGGKRLASPYEGNILCAAFDAGWFWYIPLSDTLTSVGAVVSREHVGELQKGHEGALQKFIASCPIIAEYLKNATRITEGHYGKLRVRKDYSYSSTKFWTPGMVLIGDAACFVDPVFSSGVHLATYSAMLAARSINSILRDGMDEQRVFVEFEMRYRREYGNFYQFLTAFYNLDQDQDSYFWSARKVLNSEEEANEAFVRLVAGVGSSGEPLFGSANDFFQTMTAVNASFQRAQSTPGKFDQSKLDRTFMSNFTHEAMQLQVQGMTNGTEMEMPLWESGLIPSADGMHWTEAPSPVTFFERQGEPA
jgi:halogenation protein CepH